MLHIAAFVSPAADYHPKQAMKTNYGSTQNIIRAIFELGQQDVTRLVYIGTVAETGDRMPPIHWGRVGDPIKPSMFDYYAVSKVAAERLVIESGLKHWVSLRQTGIIGKAMSEIEDAIMFHNCFDNVLEYCSDRDSARAMKNLCAFFHDGTLDESFWGHIYNIGGGESCRVSTYEMYRIMYGAIGLTKLDYTLSPKKEATRNFHGQYYLDSDKLEQYLHFRSNSKQYFYDCYLEKLGTLATVSKVLCRLPGGRTPMNPRALTGRIWPCRKATSGSLRRSPPQTPTRWWCFSAAAWWNCPGQTKSGRCSIWACRARRGAQQRRIFSPERPIQAAS